MKKTTLLISLCFISIVSFSQNISDFALTGAQFKHVSGENLPIGNNDLYTVPSGKKALIYSRIVACNTYTNSLTPITFYPQIKVSGSYYRLGADYTIKGTNFASAAQAAIFIAVPIVLTEGEIISVNISANPGLNVWYSVLEFDASNKLYSSKILSLSLGNNTLVTIPTNRTAVFLGNVNDFGGIGGVENLNNSGVMSHYSFYSVKSGDTPSTLNAFAQNVPSGGSGGATGLYVNTMDEGDYLVVSTTTSGGGQIAWCTYYLISK